MKTKKELMSEFAKIGFALRFIRFSWFFVFLSVVSCSVEPFFNLDMPKEVLIESEGGELEYNLKSNNEWSVSSSEPWCGVTPSSGTSAPDGLVVNLVCEPNDSPDTRQCILTFVSGESVVNVVVKQDLKTMFSVSETSFNLSQASARVAVGVSTTEDYDIVISSDAKSWISIVSTRSLSKDSVYFSVAANETYSSRRGEIILKQRNSGNIETIVVSQSQKDYLEVSKTEFEIGSEGETVVLEVIFNIDWEVVIPKDGKSWVKVETEASTRALDTGHIRLVIAANDKYTSRETVLSIRQKGGESATEVVIKQLQKDRLVVSPKKYSLTRIAQSLELKVTANVEWEIVVPEDAKDWISGVSNTLSVTANKDLIDRQAWVYLVQVGGTLKDSVSITQQRDLLIKVLEPKVLSSSKQYVEVVVEEANVGYDVKPSVNWISYDKSRSQYPEKLVFYVSANTSDQARTGTVVLQEKKGEGKCEFSIRQSPTSYLKPLSDTVFVGNKAGEAVLGVSTNVLYEIVVPEDCRWLSVASTPQSEILSDVSIGLKVDQNNLYVDRSATLELRMKGGSITKRVVVNQAQRPLNSGSEYIAVFGDIQYYTNAGRINLFKKSLKWITKQVDNGSSFKCVLHTGDVTHNDELNLQWRYFGDAIKDFYLKVPFISAIGDHDYRWPDGVHITDRVETYFSWFLSLPTTRVVSYFEPYKMENVVVANYIHGKPYYILCLEFGPRHEVVAWASEFVASHPDIKFILLNHEYMENGGGLRVSNLKCKIRIQNSSYTTPTQLWERLVKPNDNIAWVICGHVGNLYSYMEKKNVLGRDVPQIQHNIQAAPYYDDNWLMLWEFPQNSDNASVRIVNTASGELFDGKEELFSFKYR